MNLLKETKDLLEKFNKTLDDIKWIGGNNFQISKEQFVKLADIEYDSGYGHQVVACDLILVGADFWLERREYDGSEWWEYEEMPQKPPEVRKIHTLCGSVAGTWWSTLEELNKNGMGRI